VAKFTVQLTDEMDEALAEVAKRRGVPKTQALRRAVALMKYLDEADRSGEKVIVKTKDGEERQIVFESQTA
jgi:predicted transcriptional regulator